MYEMCNLNFRQLSKENVDTCFFFYTESLLCAMFTEY